MVWITDFRHFFEAGFVKGPIDGKEKNHRNELETYGVFFTVEKLYNNLHVRPGMIHPPSKWELRERKRMEMVLEIPSKLRFITQYHDVGFFHRVPVDEGQGQWGVSVAEIENYFLDSSLLHGGP